MQHPELRRFRTESSQPMFPFPVCMSVWARPVNEVESAFHGTRPKHFDVAPLFLHHVATLAPRATSDCGRWFAFCLFADRVRGPVRGRK
ncbi:hypothetical protein CPT_Menos_053 [Burkholderia phage Menos]|uniref:Uncharacterized protein n=1 Tax=Burkholderia phage Menos TaxID=2924900 RepID=A0AAE9G3A8_9CAUD|nr:hypothetical protein CPT_Menos_053 [Burkholderia phage Menos]